MNLYEINQELLNLVDEETGEIIDFDRLTELSMEKNEKIENIGCWIKNLLSDAAELKKEADNLSKRKKAAENKAVSLKNYLCDVLAGAEFKTAKVQISYRRSETVVIEDGFTAWAEKHCPDLVTYSEPKIDKNSVKAMLKLGEKVEFARIEEHNNIQIK